jgi:hypothetical protein
MPSQFRRGCIEVLQPHEEVPVKGGRIVALVLGCLLVLPGVGLLVGGGALAISYAAARDGQGYVNASVDPLQTSAVAVTSQHLDFGSDVEGPDALWDTLDVRVRLQMTSSADQPVFVGIARSGAVDAYLAGTAHDVVADVGRDGSVTYRHRGGDLVIAPPTRQGFWSRSAWGKGTQEVTWSVRPGHWSAVLMNADGSPGVTADLEVGTKAGFVFPLAVGMGGLGLVLLAAGVVLIVVAVTRGGSNGAEPAGAGPGSAPGEYPGRGTPVTLSATLDPALSRWKWLVKWFLAIPHFIVLVFLWVAFVVLTVVAFFAILFTGRYPRGIFDFNVGVLRWTWRVSFYATNGGLATDRYPPFRLAAQPAEPASLDIDYPDRLSRGLVLVKWWLLAIPHYAVLAILVGGTFWGSQDHAGIYSGGLLSLLVLIAALALLFTGRYPVSLFNLVVGLNRWFYRVVAYVALMTDAYPPFRLDQGGTEPQRIGPVEPRSGPDSGAAAHEEGATVIAVPGQHEAHEAESSQPQPARS